MKDHIKLTMTGPATAVEEGKSPEELRDSYVTVLVARHFEAMWVHMRQGLESLPAPHHRLTDQVCCCRCRCSCCCYLSCILANVCLDLLLMLLLTLILLQSLRMIAINAAGCC